MRELADPPDPPLATGLFMIKTTSRHGFISLYHGNRLTSQQLLSITSQLHVYDVMCNKVASLHLHASGKDVDK